jgi:MFS family permease
MNSSDMFLLLKAKESGLSDERTISLYIFYNLVYAVTSFQMGIFSDRFGKKKIFLLGIIFFIVTYAGMAFNSRLEYFYLLFIFYGLFAASTEGITKAWVSNVCEKVDLATALGFQSTTQSLASMCASFLAGALWMMFGSFSVFIFSAIGAFFTFIFLSRDKTIGRN